MQVLQQHTTTDIEPQDEAMDQFRKVFPLVCDCKVSEDGVLMTYQLKSLSGAVNSLNDAERVINSNYLPLKAKLKGKYTTGKELRGFELQIIYQPK